METHDFDDAGELPHPEGEGINMKLYLFTRFCRYQGVALREQVVKKGSRKRIALGEKILAEVFISNKEMLQESIDERIEKTPLLLKRNRIASQIKKERNKKKGR